MYQLIQNIRAVLQPAEKRALNRHLLLGVLMSLLDIVFLVLAAALVNFGTGGKGGLSPYLPGGFIGHNLTAIATGLAALFCLKNLTGYWVTQAQYGYNYGVAARMSKTRLMQYLQSGYFDYINTDSSVYQYRIAQQPVEFSQYLLSGVQQLVMQGSLIALSVAAIFIYSAQLLLLLGVFMLVPVLLLSWLIRKKIKAIRTHVRTDSERSLQHLRESLSAYIESHIFDKGDFFTNRYSGYQQQLNAGLARLQAIQVLPSRIFEAFAVAGVFMMMLFKPGSAAGSVNLVPVGVFMSAAFKIIPGLIKVITCAGQMRAYEHTLSNIQNAPETASITQQAAAPLTAIQFADVSFKYGRRTILENLDIDLNSGDMAGLSSASGKGKTTLVNVLLGFLEPSSGSVYINSLMADQRTRIAYRRQISYVKQSALLIHDSILKNIVLTDEAYDRVRLNLALSVSGLNEVVKQYADGIHKLVTENGSNLSGGQRQRIMLARALYKDFDLLILDEPFSELDELSEIKILQNLKMFTSQGKIILLITHNRQSLSECNKLLTLDAIPALHEA